MEDSKHLEKISENSAWFQRLRGELLELWTNFSRLPHTGWKTGDTDRRKLSHSLKDCCPGTRLWNPSWPFPRLWSTYRGWRGHVRSWPFSSNTPRAKRVNLWRIFGFAWIGLKIGGTTTGRYRWSSKVYWYLVISFVQRLIRILSRRFNPLNINFYAFLWIRLFSIRDVRLCDKFVEC